MLYPLLNIHKTIENHHFKWENPLYMVIFNSYVKLPEGRTLQVLGETKDFELVGQIWNVLDDFGMNHNFC